MQSMTALSCWFGVMPTIVNAIIRIAIGTGSTRLGGSSSFFQAEYIRLSLKSWLPLQSRRGSLVPIPASVWPTSLTASSTERARFGSPLGEMRPSRQRSANVCKSGTGSATSERFGLTAMEVQNDAQSSQAFLAFLSREGTTPASTVFAASSKSARRASRAAGGAAARRRSEDKLN